MGDNRSCIGERLREWNHCESTITQCIERAPRRGQTLVAPNVARFRLGNLKIVIFQNKMSYSSFFDFSHAARLVYLGWARRVATINGRFGVFNICKVQTS